MFYWALFFFLVALGAALLGFGGLAGFLAVMAEGLFYVGLVLFVVTLVWGIRNRRRWAEPPPGR